MVGLIVVLSVALVDGVITVATCVVALMQVRAGVIVTLLSVMESEAVPRWVL